MNSRTFVQIIIAASFASVVGVLTERWLKNGGGYHG